MVRITRSQSRASQNSTTTTSNKDFVPDPDTLSLASSAVAEDFLISGSRAVSPELPVSDENFQRRFFIMQDNFSSGEIYSLPHPRSGNSALYMLDHQMNPFELMHVADMMDGKQSIFYGDSVISDPGQILMFLPVHPLFLALPYLHTNASEKFFAPEEFLADKKFPALCLMASNDKLLTTLKIVADSEYDGSILKFRFNSIRIMDWLKMKYDVLKASVKLNVDSMKEGSTSDYYSLGILMDYLSEPIAEMLRVELAIDEKDIDMKTGNVEKAKRTPTNGGRKRIVANSLIDELVSPKTAPNKKIQRMSKALAVASKGTRSLKSFFTNAGENKSTAGSSEKEGNKCDKEN